MKLAITQPNYLPWLGYFDLLDVVDRWVVLDNVQLARRSFTVRNRVKLSEQKTSWLTVSLHRAPRSTPIKGSRLILERPWWEAHARRIEAAYRDATHFEEHFDWLREVITPRPDEETLARYNARVVLSLAARLGMDPIEVSFASALEPELTGSAQDKILALCDHFDTDAYYNFASGVREGLYQADAFAARGIQLYMHAFEHPEYPQLHGAFTSHLSVLDALFNVGAPRTLELIREGSRWDRVEP